MTTASFQRDRAATDGDRGVRKCILALATRISVGLKRPTLSELALEKNGKRRIWNVSDSYQGSSFSG